LFPSFSFSHLQAAGGDMGKIKAKGELKMTQAQMKELKTLLKGYRHINKKIIRFFESIGCTVQQHGNHCKIITADGRYVVISKTPSDVRGGLNAYAKIIKVIG